MSKDQSDFLDKWRGVTSFCSLLIAIGFTGWLFIYLQAALIDKPLMFCTIIFVLIVFSFFASASEAAIGIAATRQDIREKINDEQLRLAQEISPFEQNLANGGTSSLSRPANRRLQRLLRKIDRLSIKRAALDGTDRDEFVGALSTFSVFLNTALAAFLPFTLAATLPENALIEMPWIDFGIGRLAQGGWSFNPTLVWINGTSIKVLVFVAASIPILLFGKLLPKIIGYNIPVFFAYSCFSFNRLVRCIFGWVTLGVRWPIQGLIDGGR